MARSSFVLAYIFRMAASSSSNRKESRNTLSCNKGKERVFVVSTRMQSVPFLSLFLMDEYLLKHDAGVEQTDAQVLRSLQAGGDVHAPGSMAA